tara:strand:+ start:344 stop:490 length:147 start_codon:yes stop_codon:yes gene_type:complete
MTESQMIVLVAALANISVSEAYQRVRTKEDQFRELLEEEKKDQLTEGV